MGTKERNRKPFVTKNVKEKFRERKKNQKKGRSRGSKSDT